MITSPQSRIDEYTEKGWWGHETLHSLLAKAVDEFPERLAVAFIIAINANQRRNLVPFGKLHQKLVELKQD